MGKKCHSDRIANRDTGMETETVCHARSNTSGTKHQSTSGTATWSNQVQPSRLLLLLLL